MGWFRDKILDPIGNAWDDITGQTAAREASEAQQRAVDQSNAALAPYRDAAQVALPEMQTLLGLNGVEEQQEAIAALENSPLFEASVRQGEEAMLQTASATGGLRGGNMQAALAQYRPMMLNQAIQQQFANLASTAGLAANPTAQTASNIMAGGEATAANRLAQYMLPKNFIMDYVRMGTEVAKGAATGGAF